MAVARGGDAGEPRRLHFQRVEVMPFRGRSHRGRALAGGETDHAAFRDGTQMRCEHHIGMRGSHGGIVNRAQKGASVGHFVML